MKEEKSKEKNEVHHFYSLQDIKKDYKFWKTQLVPQFHKKLPIELGPLKSEFKEEDIPKNCYELPENMEWKEIDILKEEECQKLFDFLYVNYCEDEDVEYKEQYNKEFIRWQFSPIKNNKYKNILLSIQINQKIIGFFSGLPMKLYIYGKEIIAYNISFLCIDKQYRKHNLAQILFKELFRRTYLENVYQNIFVSKRLIPKPFAESTYYYKILDLEIVKEMIDKGEIPKDIDIKQFEIKDETRVKFRPMEKKDVKCVTKLLYENQKKYKIHSIFSEDEVEHWFIPIKNVIYSFVKENEEGNITDFTSFYKIDATFLGKKQNWCYLYFNIATSMTSKELLENAMILAKKEGMNDFVCNNIMDYEKICKELNFHSNIEDENSYGSLKYYFNNFVCPETEAKDISLILI